MHELSLAGSILNIVEDTARREHFSRVSHLRLAAGALSGIEVRALRFALESMVSGTCLAQAQIDIDTPPGQGWCMRCAQSVQLHSRLDACPHCAGHQIQVTGGDELRVVDMVVEDDLPLPPA